MHESSDIGEVDGLEGMGTNVPHQGQEAAWQRTCGSLCGGSGDKVPRS